MIAIHADIKSRYGPNWKVERANGLGIYRDAPLNPGVHA